MYYTRSRRRAFTLVELLVVMLIVSILMAIAVPMYLSTVTDSQIKTARANMQTIASAVQAYRVRWQVYPSSLAALSGDLGNTAINGPAGRTAYSFSTTGGTCTDNQDNPVGSSPPFGFSVNDNVASDGVYCLGVSPD